MDRKERRPRDTSDRESIAGAPGPAPEQGPDPVEALAIAAAADRVERLAPLDNAREPIAFLRFFTVGAVCDDLAVDRKAVVDELIRRRDRRETIARKGH